MLEMLLVGEQSVGQFVSAFPEMSQSAVSQHLKVLREVNLVRARVDGSKRMYSLVPETLREVDQWIMRYRHFWARRLDTLARHLNEHPK